MARAMAGQLDRLVGRRAQATRLSPVVRPVARKPLRELWRLVVDDPPRRLGSDEDVELRLDAGVIIKQTRGNKNEAAFRGHKRGGRSADPAEGRAVAIW